MLEEQRQKRLARTEGEIGALSYERYRLGKEIEACQRRIAEIDLGLATAEGAIRESEQTRQDIATQEAIDKAKAQTEAPASEKEGHKDG